MAANDGSVMFALRNNRKHDERNRPWYDTKAGIEKSLSSLHDFMNLVKERSAAGYKRNERLNEFYVLGRYSLDTCGNCGKFSGWIPKEEIPSLPDVMSRDDFWAYVKANVSGADEISVSSGLSLDLPFDDVTCPVCKKTWGIHNCHDTVVIHKTEVFNLSVFVGKTLREVKAVYENKKDAHYMMQRDILIRNDRFIDLSPKYPNSNIDWEKGFVKNERGWMSEQDGIGDDYIISAGDEGFFNVWTYYHRSCNRLNLAFEEEKFFREVFEKAGYMFPVFHHLPNGYYPSDRDYAAPWFKVQTELGTITIGWRKRVVNIDWSEDPRAEKKILSLFSAEEVTKGDTYIHAWGKDKAIEYLSKIRDALSQ